MQNDLKRPDTLKSAPQRTALTNKGQGQRLTSVPPSLNKAPGESQRKASVKNRPRQSIFHNQSTFDNLCSRRLGPSKLEMYHQLASALVQPLLLLLVVVLFTAYLARGVALRSREDSSATAEALANALLKDQASATSAQSRRQAHALEQRVSSEIFRPQRLLPEVAPVAEFPSEQVKHADLLRFISGVIAVYHPEIENVGETARQIIELSAQADLDPLYVASVISAESRFRSRAKSHVGAQGLMQVLPSTARALAREQGLNSRNIHLMDPETNIALGIEYLKQLEEQYHGNRFLALAAYNWGPGNIAKAQEKGQKIPKSVRNYAKTILQRSERWREHFKETDQSVEILRASNEKEVSG